MEQVTSPTVVRVPPRAEPVGSLLRSNAIKSLFERAYAKHDSHVIRVLDAREQEALAELDALADEAIRVAVARQIDAGLDVVTDGEMRRAHFVNSLFDAVEGVADNPRKYYFAGDEEIAPPSDPVVTERLRLVANPLIHEVTFLRQCTDRPYKVTLPAISNFYMMDYPTDAYPSREAFVAHMQQLCGELASGAVKAGAHYIQFDFPLYPALADPEKRLELERALGEDGDSLLGKAIDADNGVLTHIENGVTVAIHMCRGNYRSRWWARGSLEPVAERMFTELRYDRFLVEWEDVEREGDYAPLRFVPVPGPIVVMGLVSTKVPRMESDEELLRQIDAAASLLDVSQLAISPQCGFASVWHGNEITEDTQWRKLELVGRVAERVWGTPSGADD